MPSWNNRLKLGGRPSLPKLISYAALILILLAWWQSERWLRGDTLRKDAEMMQLFHGSCMNLE
jgi:hypothetical protein